MSCCCSHWNTPPLPSDYGLCTSFSPCSKLPVEVKICRASNFTKDFRLPWRCYVCLENVEKPASFGVRTGSLNMKTLMLCLKIYPLRGKAKCEAYDFTIKNAYLDYLNKLGPPFILLLTSNFMREDYFPGEQIVLPISILIFSVEHSAGCCLFKTKLSEYLPSLCATDSEQNKHCGKELFNFRRGFGTCKSDGELYSKQSSDPNEFHRVYHRTYHQQRNAVTKDVWLRTPSKRLGKCPSLVKLPPFSSNFSLTSLLIMFLITSMFPYSKSAAPLITKNQTLILNPAGKPGGYYSTVEYSTPKHPEVNLFCESFSLQNLQSITGLRGCSEVCVQQNDKYASLQVKQFEFVIQKYATAISYSAQWSMESCKTAYKDWICSQHHKIFKAGPDGVAKLDACPSLCKTVESSCPFFRVYADTKLYGGQPTFLCKGQKKNNLKNNSSECYYITQAPIPRSQCTSDTVFGPTDSVAGSRKNAICREEEFSSQRTIRVRSLAAASSAISSLNWRFNCLLFDVRLFLYLLVMMIQDLIKIA